MFQIRHLLVPVQVSSSLNSVIFCLTRKTNFVLFLYSKVKVLYKFTKAGGSISTVDTRSLLQVVGAEDEDKQLLKFWTSGLSTQYRTHILTTSKSQH